MAAARTMQQIGREPVFELREQRRITDVGPRWSGDAAQKRDALAPAPQAVGPWLRIEAERPYAREQRGGDRGRFGRGERRIGENQFAEPTLAARLHAFTLRIPGDEVVLRDQVGAAVFDLGDRQRRGEKAARLARRADAQQAPIMLGGLADAR